MPPIWRMSTRVRANLCGPSRSMKANIAAARTLATELKMTTVLQPTPEPMARTRWGRAEPKVRAPTSSPQRQPAPLHEPCRHEFHRRRINSRQRHARRKTRNDGTGCARFNQQQRIGKPADQRRGGHQVLHAPDVRERQETGCQGTHDKTGLDAIGQPSSLRGIQRPAYGQFGNDGGRRKPRGQRKYQCNGGDREIDPALFLATLQNARIRASAGAERGINPNGIRRMSKDPALCSSSSRRSCFNLRGIRSAEPVYPIIHRAYRSIRQFPGRIS